jgi:quinol monooxygenase YgiN
VEVLLSTGRKLDGGIMGKQIISIDSSEIRAGKLEQLKKVVQELVDFVQENETSILSYHMFIDERINRMTVVQVHPDSGSMENHLKVAGPVFSKFGDLISLKTMDIYGFPSESLVEQLRDKMQMLGTGIVSVHKPQAGFTRIGGEKGRE